MMNVSTLIIGDDPNVGKLNEIVLTEAGYKARYVQSFTEGQELFWSETPDLLVMQHNPQISQSVTVDFYHAIRNNPATATVPIIVVRCEQQEARELYTVETDSALVFLPIIYWIDEFRQAASHLILLHSDVYRDT